jgi:hypothetical protein
LIITITVGIITLFVAMGFAYKVSKKLALWKWGSFNGWPDSNLQFVRCNFFYF